MGDDESRYEYPYNLGKYSKSWWTVMRVMTDEVPGIGPCGTRSVARDLVAGGSPGVFVYVFEHPPQEPTGIPCELVPHPIWYPMRTGIPCGCGPGSVLVPHASELVFAFGD